MTMEGVAQDSYTHLHKIILCMCAHLIFVISKFAVCHLSVATSHVLLGTHHLLFAGSHLLIAVCHLWPAICHLPLAI